ncbi:MAG: protein kinase, partial [Planctomycetes bacterium]|nr:protein kinase [Planctomycetota bacterium]
ARMMREAQVVATLEHPNIVRIHDVLQDGLVMELVRGRPLELKALPLEERVRVLEEVARAIQAAHERGVVHRDLKPGNVLREETGRVVVMDFGLAHLAEARSRLTRSGAAVGTPLYMAPEQIRGERVDGRADVYSLGVMLYEALAGRAPFTAPTVGQLYVKVLAEAPPPLKGVPKDLVTVCFRALAKDPRDRYRTAGALGEDLASHRAGRGIAARPLSTWTRLVRRKAVVSVAAAMGLLVVFAAGAMLKLRRTQEDVTKAQGVLVEEMRRTSATCLEAALDLRRVGKVDRMGEYASKVYAICDRVIREHPRLAEPHYLRGRMFRALMKDKEALEEQERALAKEPGYVPAVYERLVLVARLHRRRLRELEEEEQRGAGRMLMEEGAGEVRAGKEWRVRSGQELAKTDPKALRLMETMEKDLASLNTGRGALTEGQRACAQGLQARVADRCEEVRTILGGAVEKEPHLEEAYEALAAHEEWHGEYEEAVRWLSEGIVRDRGCVLLLQRRGDASLTMGALTGGVGEDPRGYYEAAIEDFTETLKLDPGNDEGWLGRGAARMNWGKHREGLGENSRLLYEGAIADLGEALKLNPARDETWIARSMARMNWGVCASVRGEDPGKLYEGAIADLGEALELNPANDKAWTYRGAVRVNWGAYKAWRGEDPEGLYEEAIADMGEALKLNPARDETWMWRGRARRWWGAYKGDRGEDPASLYSAAIEDFGEALKLNAVKAQTWLSRGAVLMTWGCTKGRRGEDPRALLEAAIEDFGKALQLNPASDQAWMHRGAARLNLGVFKQKQGEDPSALLEAAAEDLRRALAINRSSAMTWQCLGETEFNHGQHLESRREAAASHYRFALEAYRQGLHLNPALESEIRGKIEECRKRVESTRDE